MNARKEQERKWIKKERYAWWLIEVGLSLALIGYAIYLAKTIRHGSLRGAACHIINEGELVILALVLLAGTGIRCIDRVVREPKLKRLLVDQLSTYVVVFPLVAVILVLLYTTARTLALQASVAQSEDPEHFGWTALGVVLASAASVASASAARNQIDRASLALLR